jgi:hypothetical protein
VLGELSFYGCISTGSESRYKEPEEWEAEASTVKSYILDKKMEGAKETPRQPVNWFSVP